MQAPFAAFKRRAISGLLFLLPVYILLVVVTKAWTSLSTLGAKLAGAFGVKSIMGIGASSILSGVSLLVFWFICGWLAEVSRLAAFRTRLEGWLATYIPGYAAYRSMIEDKLRGRTKILPYPTALLRQSDVWRPVYVVDQDAQGVCLVFAPNVPDTSQGMIVVAKQQDVFPLPALAAADFDAALKKLGAGLVSQYRIDRQVCEANISGSARTTVAKEGISPAVNQTPDTR